MDAVVLEACALKAQGVKCSVKENALMMLGQCIQPVDQLILLQMRARGDL